MDRRVQNLLQVLSCAHLSAWSLYWTTHHQPLTDRQTEINAKLAKTNYVKMFYLIFNVALAMFQQKSC